MSRPGFSFSHFGMHVTNLAKLEDFYTRILDFTVTDRGHLDRPGGKIDLVFLSRDPDEHHQIVLVSGRPPDMAFNPINQISLKADSLATLCSMHIKLQREGLQGITPITHGNAVSIYVPDPEGNRLELYYDLPWYASQPLAIPVDLSGDETALMERLESHARSLPGFKTRLEWRAEMCRRMGLA